MQSINHANFNSNGDASPPDCDSDELEVIESRSLALRRKSTFGPWSTKSKVLVLSVHKHSAGVGAGVARTRISYFRRTNTQRHSEKNFFYKNFEKIFLKIS